MPDLDARAERELLQLLEEALGQPRELRRAWLESKLKERAAVGRKLKDLIDLAESRNIEL